MRRCLLDDRAHLAMLRPRTIAPPCQSTITPGVNLRLEDFSPLLGTEEEEAALLAARRLANYLTEAQESSSLGITGIEPELLILALERLEHYVTYHTCPNMKYSEDVRSSDHAHQILSAILSIFTVICANSHTMVLAGVVSADDAVEKSLAQRLDDSVSLVRRLLRSAQSLIEHPNLKLYEPTTMALRLIGNLASHGMPVACYLFTSGIVDSVCTLMSTGLYSCFTSIRAEVQWLFTAIASHLPSDQGGDNLVVQLDKHISLDPLSKTYLEIALESSTSYIANSLRSLNTHNDGKLYDRWYLAICWLMYSFMCPCLVSRASISDASVLELVVRSISAAAPDISNIAITALNQYSMNVPTDVKKGTISTSHIVTLLRHSFISIFSSYIDASTYGKVDSYHLSILKEALVFLNNENSESEMPGFWVQPIASLYAKLLRAHRAPSADTIEVLELLTEALGSTVSICSNETMNLLCSSSAQIFAQLVKLLKSYKPCVQARQMMWKRGSILLNISELLRTTISYVPEVDLKLHKNDLLSTIGMLLAEDIDMQTATILEELEHHLSSEDN